MASNPPSSSNPRARRGSLAFPGLRDARVIEAVRTVHTASLGLPGAQDANPTGSPPSLLSTQRPFVDVINLMVQALELRGDERVLEIGTGTGYQAALLSRLAREVYSIALNPELAERAREVLQDLRFMNVHVATGNPSVGWPEASPYQAIVVSGAVATVPTALIQQLADGGRLIVPLGDRRVQMVERFRKGPQSLVVDTVTGASFEPLLGYGDDERPSFPWTQPQDASTESQDRERSPKKSQ